jgi:hypothetical protein
MAEEEKNFSLKGRKLFVGIPTYDGKLNIAAAYELPQLAMSSLRYQFSIHLAHISGCSLITKARNSLINQFLKSDCTELLFIDSDIHFKHEDILRIMALGSDRDILCGSYPRRADDKKFFTDIYYNENDGVELTENGLLRVLRIGTGFMFIRRHVIEKLINDHPEWKYWNNVEETYHYALFDFQLKNEHYFGEDYLFCDRATEAGFKIYVDPDINLGHYGQTEFTGHFGKLVLEPMIENTIIQLKVANG